MYRKISNSDIQEVCKLEQKCFEHEGTWNNETIEHYCCNGDGFVCVKNNKIVGFALLCRDKCEILPYHRVLTLADFGVDPDNRRQGIGVGLIEYIKEHYKEPIYLQVRSKNIIAQQLYLKCGFEKIAVLKDYYKWSKLNDDAHYMRWKPQKQANKCIIL
jgi:ribosomal protein S18 acetylase RimI-like enzyme